MRNLIIAGLVTLFLYGCGENPVNNNGNNPPPVSNDSLILTIDSISIRGIGYHSLDSLIPIISLDSFKITFTSSTNCTNTDNLIVVKITDTYLTYLDIENVNDLNKNHTIYFRKKDTGYPPKFGLIFESLFSRFLKLSNIKVYLIH